MILLLVFVFLYFDKLFVNPIEDIFSTPMSLTLVYIMIILISERYISRADVRVKVQKGDLVDKKELEKDKQRMK